MLLLVSAKSFLDDVVKSTLGETASSAAGDDDEFAMVLDPSTSRSTSNTARGSDLGTTAPFKVVVIESSNISCVSANTSSLYAPTCMFVLIGMSPL